MNLTALLNFATFIIQLAVTSVLDFVVLKALHASLAILILTAPNRALWLLVVRLRKAQEVARNHFQRATYCTSAR